MNANHFHSRIGSADALPLAGTNNGLQWAMVRVSWFRLWK